MKYPYKHKVTEQRRINTIILSDAAAEGDDAFAIAHALLSERFDVRAVGACHFGKDGSMDKSYARIKELFSVMDIDRPLLHGNECAHDYSMSESAMAISQESQQNKTYILALGPLTDIAKAISMPQTRAANLIVVWTGGEEKDEFNLSNDRDSFSQVRDSSVQLYQIPRSVYLQMGISFAEIETRIASTGRLGDYLYQQLLDYSQAKTTWSELRSGETWTLGDNAAVGVMLYENPYNYKIDNRGNRLYHSIDGRLILEDLIAKLSLIR